MLRQEHVGVESAVRSSCRQHGPLVTDGRVVHDPHPPRRRTADDLVGLGVPNHTRYAGIRGGVHLCVDHNTIAKKVDGRAHAFLVMHGT